MTIRACINAAALSADLSNLETCANEAPEGAYEDAKAFNGLLADIYAYVSEEARRIGLVTNNCDGWREVEAVMYGMFKTANPESTMFAVAEGFGKAMTDYGPETRARVLAQTADNMAFLKSVGVVK